MNGRIYDPLLGRFLSADIVVQFPGNLQSFNRYSYVLNNPLSFTDPSGFAVSVDDKVKEAMVKAEAADEARRRAAVTGDAPDLKSIITGTVASGCADAAEPAAKPATKKIETNAPIAPAETTPDLNVPSPAAGTAPASEPAEKKDPPAPRKLTVIIVDSEDMGGLGSAPGTRLLGCAQATKDANPNVFIVDAREDFVQKLKDQGVRDGEVVRTIVADHGSVGSDPHDPKNPPVPEMGASRVGPDCLNKMKPFMAEKADVVLLNCYVGLNQGFLDQMSKNLDGRRVYAPNDMYYGYPMNTLRRYIDGVLTKMPATYDPIRDFPENEPTLFNHSK